METRDLLAADLAFVSGGFTSVAPAPNGTVSLITEFVVGDLGDQPVLKAGVGVSAFLSTNGIVGDAGDIPIANTFLDINIAPGGTIEGLLVGNPQLGQFNTANFLLLQVDSLNIVAEGNENNNVLIIALPRVPVLTASPGDLTGRLHKVHRIDPGITVSDLDTYDFGAGSLIVRVENEEPGDNILSIKHYKSDDGLVRRKKNEIRIGSRLVGTVSGGLNGDPLLIDFAPAVSVEDVRRVAAAASIKGKKGIPGTREVRFFIRESPVVTGISAMKLVNLT